MANNILGLPKKALSEFQRTLNRILAKRGVPDGFVGTDTDGYAVETQLGSGTPSSANFLRGDGAWSSVSGAGLGDVTGDAVPTVDQNIVAYNGVGGKNIEELAGTQGDILYHNGTKWTQLTAGTSGYFLKTQGAAANPTWASAASGDVSAGDLSVTSGNIVAYNGGGGQSIVELSGTQGDVLYHNGSSWQKLNAGTSGYFLKTNGAGANPAWADAGGSVLTTKGDILTRDASAVARLPVGTNNYVLVADSAETTGLKWVTPSRTKTLFLPVTQWLGGTAELLGSPPEAFLKIDLGPTTETYLMTQFIMPYDWDVAQTYTLVALYASSGTSVEAVSFIAFSKRLDGTADFIGGYTDSIQLSDSPSGNVRRLEEVDLTAAINANVGANGLLALSIGRYPADDVNPDTMYFLGAVLTYKTRTTEAA